MTITGYVGCQLAGEYTSWPADQTHLLVEPKFDGYRLNAVIDHEGQVQFYCRGDQPVAWGENLEHIAADLKATGLRNCMIDGEIMARDWNRTSSLIRRKRALMDEDTKAKIVAEVKYWVFDYVDYSVGFETRMLPGRRKAVQVHPVGLAARRKILVQAYVAFGHSLRLSPQYEVYGQDSLLALFEELLELGYEGAMVKHPEAPYALDRSPYWQKLKAKKPLDLKITGVVEGLGKHVGRLGAFICVDSKGTEIKVGGGLTDAQREDFWARRETLVGLELEAEVQDDNMATTARFPQFKRLRDERK